MTSCRTQNRDDVHDISSLQIVHVVFTHKSTSTCMYQLQPHACVFLNNRTRDAEFWDQGVPLLIVKKTQHVFCAVIHDHQFHTHAQIITPCILSPGLFAHVLCTECLIPVICIDYVEYQGTGHHRLQRKIMHQTHAVDRKKKLTKPPFIP